MPYSLLRNIYLSKRFNWYSRLMPAILILNKEQRGGGNLSNLTHKMGAILPACKVAMETPKFQSSVAVATPEECTIVYVCVYIFLI